MAAVEVTITGMLYDKLNRTVQNVVLVGEASLTGLGVGGGPMPPGPGGIPGGPHPEHPIYWPPGTQPHPEHPIYFPPGSLPHPEHPIVIPPPIPVDPPSNPETPKPPPPDGGWGWHPEYGWGYFPGGGGKPQPPNPA